jgi:hypothetical protein
MIDRWQTMEEKKAEKSENIRRLLCLKIEQMQPQPAKLVLELRDTHI